MDFVALLLLNAMLFIRPMDFVPGLVGLPLFDISFCICVVLSLPALLEPGRISSIVTHPISVCVLSLGIITLLSNLLQGQFEQGIDTADGYFKICLYYVLLVCGLRTPSRLKWMLASLVVDGCIVAGLGVADYHGIMSVPGLEIIMEYRVDEMGQEGLYRRLAATGLFSDPNDLSLMIVMCVIYTIYLLGDRSVSWGLRAIWLLPIPLFYEGLRLTFSRGGALSMIIGLGVYALLRFGWRKALPPILVGLPLLLSGGGRQLDFDVSGGSGQARIHLWDRYLGLFLTYPLLGVGYGQAMRYIPQVAHNSYLQVFADRGFFGGMAFLSAMLLGGWSIIRLKPVGAGSKVFELGRQRIFLLAAHISYSIGIMTLSRADVIPTYTMLGLAVAYERMAAGVSDRGPLRLSPKLICLLALATICYFILLYIYVKRKASYY